MITTVIPTTVSAIRGEQSGAWPWDAVFLHGVSFPTGIATCARRAIWRAHGTVIGTRSSCPLVLMVAEPGSEASGRFAKSSCPNSDRSQNLPASSFCCRLVSVYLSSVSFLFS